MALWIEAGLWGLLAASGLLIGATIADTFYKKLSHSMIARVTGFGGGVLIAVACVDLMKQAFAESHWTNVVGGFLLGAAVFSFLNWRLSKHGAKNRKRCGGCVTQPSEQEHKGSGAAIALGSVLDGVPESLVIGLTLVGGGKLGAGIVLGFFLANIPQGLSSVSGMKTAGRSRAYIYSVWGAISATIAAAAALGAALLGSAPSGVPAAILAFAAGSVLATLSEVVIPEAFEDAPPLIGLITALGFIGAYLLFQSHG